MSPKVLETYKDSLKNMLDSYHGMVDDLSQKRISEAQRQMHSVAGELRKIRNNPFVRVLIWLKLVK